MAFGTSAEVLDHHGAGSRRRLGKVGDCLEEQVAWGRCWLQPAAPCAYMKALRGHADPFTWPGRWRMGSKVTEEVVCRRIWSCFLRGRHSLSLSPVVAEVLNQSPLVPPPNCLHLPCWEEKGSWPALAVLTPSLMWPKSVLPMLLRNCAGFGQERVSFLHSS